MYIFQKPGNVFKGKKTNWGTSGKLSKNSGKLNGEFMPVIVFSAVGGATEALAWRSADQANWCQGSSGKAIESGWIQPSDITNMTYCYSPIVVVRFDAKIAQIDSRGD